MRRDEVKRGRLILKALFFRLNESAEKKSNRKWICQIISTESNTHSWGSGTLWRCTKPINFNNVMNHFLAHKRRRAIIEIMCREASKCHRKSFAVLRQNSFPVHHLAALAFVLSLLRHRDGGINFIWNDFYSTPFGSCVEMSLLTSLSYSGERVGSIDEARVVWRLRSGWQHRCRVTVVGAHQSDTPKCSIIFHQWALFSSPAYSCPGVELLATRAKKSPQTVTIRAPCVWVLFNCLTRSTNLSKIKKISDSDGASQL